METTSFQDAAGDAPLVLEDVDASLALESLDAPAQLQAALNYRGERMNVDGEIGLPRAVLDKGETPVTARVTAAPLNALAAHCLHASGGRYPSGTGYARCAADHDDPGGKGVFGQYAGWLVAEASFDCRSIGRRATAVDVGWARLVRTIHRAA